MIPDPNFEDDIQMLIKETTLEDYMDREVCQYWSVYVLDHIKEYRHREKPALAAASI